MAYEKIEKLVKQYRLGDRVLSIQEITGGLLHKMYKVQTEKAVFAIKELNPAVMSKKEAYNNFVVSERVARIAKRGGINAVCALQFNKKVVLNVDGSYFMVFDWIDAHALNAEQVQTEHCEIIGQTLAKIHNIDFFGQRIKRKHVQASLLDFRRYIPLEKEPYAETLQADVELLSLNARAVAAINNLNDSLTVSHSDLDRKNVLWQNFTPYIIDWEASGCVNPTAELVQTAWYWAGGDVENFDACKFERVIASYAQTYNGKMCADYDDLVYANLYPKLAWLEYNLNRSLVKERETAQAADNEVTNSLKEIEYCVSRFDDVVKILKNSF